MARPLPSDAKRARIEDFTFGRSFASQSALREILSIAKDIGVPDAFSRPTQLRSRRKQVNVPTDFGSILRDTTIQDEDGDDVPITFLCPFAFLEVAARRSEPFREFLRSTLDACDNHLSVLAYNDEVDPGRELAVRHGRKVEMVYASFKEFGFPALTNEDAWLTLCTIRSDLRSTLPGGISYVMKLAMKQIFGKPHGLDLRFGVPFRLPGEAVSRLLTGTVRLINQDELAFKCVTHAKGSSGFMICSNCQDCANHLLRDPSGLMVPATNTDINAFTPHTDETIVRVFEQLQDGPPG